MDKPDLTPKQATFVEEYLVDLNATQAAIRAGYSKKTAVVIGCQNLMKVNIQAAIQFAKEKRSKRTEITQDKVLREYARLAFFDIRNLYDEDGVLIPIHKLDADTAAAIGGIDVVSVGGEDFIDTKKIKIIDKKGSLNDLARHLGMFEKDNKQKQTPLAAILKEIDPGGLLPNG